MKEKIYAVIALACYPCSIYGLKGAEGWLMYASLLIPFVSIVIWGIISALVSMIFKKDEISNASLIYVSFVISVFGLLFFNRTIDFMIGRMFLLIGGTMLYLAYQADEIKKHDEKVRSQFYWDLKTGKKGAKDGYIL